MEHKPGFNYGINGLRGLCILMVFLFHVEHSGIIPDVSIFETAYEHLRYFIGLFKYGVEIFFMISGYVIIGSLKRHSTAGSFLLDRALRIYPTWIPLHLLGFIAGPIVKRGIFETYDPYYWALNFITTFFFLPTILPLPAVHPAAWSLSYEWCFYLVAALTVFVFPRWLRKNWIIVVLSLITLILIELYPRGLFFIPGVLLALYEDKIRTYIKYIKFPGLALIAFLYLWGITGIAVHFEYMFMHEWIADGRIFAAAGAFLTGTYMFAGVVYNIGWGVKLLSTPVMQFYGKISYAFYLWSYVTLMLSKIIAIKLTPYLGEWGAVTFFAVLAFITATIVSWLNWLIIESYITKILKEKLKSRSTNAT